MNKLIFKSNHIRKYCLKQFSFNFKPIKSNNLLYIKQNTTLNQLRFKEEVREYIIFNHYNLEEDKIASAIKFLNNSNLTDSDIPETKSIVEFLISYIQTNKIKSNTYSIAIALFSKYLEYILTSDSSEINESVDNILLDKILLMSSHSITYIGINEITSPGFIFSSILLIKNQKEYEQLWGAYINHTLNIFLSYYNNDNLEKGLMIFNYLLSSSINNYNFNIICSLSDKDFIQTILKYFNFITKKIEEKKKEKKIKLLIETKAIDEYYSFLKGIYFQLLYLTNEEEIKQISTNFIINKDMLVPMNELIIMLKDELLKESNSSDINLRNNFEGYKGYIRDNFNNSLNQKE